MKRALIGLFLIVTGSTAFAQTGVWVEQLYTPFGTGNRMYVAGDDALGYTYENTSRLLFFSTHSASWTETELGASDYFHDLVGAGQLVLAVGERVLVAFNALTSTAHVLEYEGTLNSTSLHLESWACGDRLAIVGTSAYIYVFDAILDSWQQWSYGAPPSSVSGICYLAQDDYALAIINRAYPIPPVNVAYSLHLHAFNQAEQGVYHTPSLELMDHGFANYGGFDPNEFVLGYSALDNDFDFVSTAVGDFVLAGGGRNESDFTPTCSFAIGAVEVVTVFEHERLHLWGYDTRRGSWKYNTIDYDPDDYGYGTGFIYGGVFSMSPCWGYQNDTLEAIVYDAEQNLFYVQQPGLAYGSAFWDVAGSAYLLADENVAVGYDLLGVRHKVQGLDGEWWSQSFAGQDFITFSRWSNGSDRMTNYVYNRASNAWTTTEIWKNQSASGFGTERLFAHTGAGDEHEVLLYSADHNATHLLSYPAGTWPSVHAKGRLALVTTPGEAVLFDAVANTLATYSLGNASSGLSDRIYVGLEAGTHLLRGYSSLTETWTPLDTGQAPFVLTSGDRVGWASVNGYGQYWAFNAAYDEWVPLVPEGSWLGSTQGGRTLLVVRSDRLYAFAPGADTPVVLNSFSLGSEPGRVTLRWEVNAGDYAFRLTAQGGEELWHPDFVEESEGVYLAIDDHDYLRAGGEFRYLLEGREPGEDWQLLRSESVSLPAALQVPRLVGLYPNPGNPNFTIQLALDREEWLRVSVYDVEGRRVARLHEGVLARGEHRLGWDGRSDTGAAAASGLYLVRLQSRSAQSTARLVLMR